MRQILNTETTCYWVGPAASSSVIVDASAYYAAFYAAASLAQRYILLAGWQFDTSVKLLRGADARAARYPVELLPFLDALCRERPELRVYILAWDYSIIYALEREWLQSLKVAFQSSSSIRFEYDEHPGFGGSHHQKLAVIDGVTAFAGGLDICEDRWDDRSHAPQHECRINRSGEPCRPNHEVQAAVQGEAAQMLTNVFLERWRSALGEELELRPYFASPAADLPIASLDESAILTLRADEVGISRTLHGGNGAAVREVLSAYSLALSTAEHLIYIETQYFTSRSITEVLLERLRNPHKSRLQLVIMIPRGADNSKEKFALGDIQAARLSDLEQAAEAHGHELRFLCSAVAGDNCESATFIHSKLLIVDDVFLCVGSANLTERSMSLDSELCLLWQAEPDTVLVEDIRRVRASLLAEHAGRATAELLDSAGLIRQLDEWLENKSSRLRRCHFEPVSASPLKEAIFDPGADPAPSQESAPASLAWPWQR